MSHGAGIWIPVVKIGNSSLIVMVPPDVGVPSEFHQCATVVVVGNRSSIDVFVDLTTAVSRHLLKARSSTKQINLFFQYNSYLISHKQALQRWQ